MALPTDEELDPLVINETPRPTGAVVDEANQQAAPNDAPAATPAPDEEADPFQPSAPPSAPEQAATPQAVPSPRRISEPNADVAAAAQGDAFTPKTVPEPRIFHRKASDPDVEAQQQADEQQRAADMQRADQKTEDQRAKVALTGLKASGVLMEVDPVTGKQRPKLDADGQPVYKPAVLDPWHEDDDGTVSEIKRDYKGATVAVPLKPKLDPVTGMRYVTSPDGTQRKDLGPDEGFLQRKSMTLAGQAAAVAKGQLTAITTQTKALQKQRDDVVNSAADLDPKDQSPDAMLKRKQIQIDRARIDGQMAAIASQRKAAQDSYSSAQGEFLKQKQAFIDSTRAKAGLPPLNSPQAPDGQTPATSPTAAIVATATAVSQDPVGFVERVKEMWANKEFIPYLGTGIEIKHMLELGAAGKRLLDAEKAGTTATPQDAQLVANYLQRAARPESGWAKMASIVGQSASFGGELGIASLLGIATAPAGGAGGIAAEGEALAAHAAAKAAKIGLDVLAERSARSFLTKQIGKVLGQDVADGLAWNMAKDYAGAEAATSAKLGLAGTIGEIAAKTGGKVVQAAALTPIASPLRIAAQVIQDTSPVKMSLDQAGKVSVMANDERDGFVQAVGNATLSNYIENLSEFSGGIFKYVPVPKAVSALKAAILVKLQQAGQLAPFAQKIATAANRTAQLAHWHGVLPEIGEEYIGGAMHAAVGQGTFKDQLPGVQTAMDEGIGPAMMKDILPMAAAFLVPGTVSNVSRATANWIGSMKKGQAVTNLDPADEAAILKDLADSGATSSAMTPEGKATNLQMAKDEHASVSALINDPTTPPEQKAALIQRRDELAAQLQGGEDQNGNTTTVQKAAPATSNVNPGDQSPPAGGGPVQAGQPANAAQGQTGQGAQGPNGQPVGSEELLNQDVEISPGRFRTTNEANVPKDSPSVTKVTSGGKTYWEYRLPETPSVQNPGGAATSKPSTEGEKKAAPKGGPSTRIAGPALVEGGKVVEQGKIGETHADLIARAAQRGVDATDAEHAFTDEHGNVLNRTEAAPIAEKAGQRRKGTSGPLHSQHLQEAPTSTKTNPSDGEAGDEPGATPPPAPKPPKAPAGGDAGTVEPPTPPQGSAGQRPAGEGTASSEQPTTGRAERHFREALTKGKVKAVLDALGVTIRPTDKAKNFAATFEERGGKVSYFLDRNAAHTDSKTAAMSDDEARSYTDNAIEEEITHFAQFEAVRRAWAKAHNLVNGSPRAFSTAFATAYAGVSAAMVDAERQAAGDAYGDGWAKLTPGEQAAEFVRQLLQRERVGTITEATIRAKPIIERILAVLDELLKKIHNAPEALRHAYEHAKAVLEEISGEKPIPPKPGELNFSEDLGRFEPMKLELMDPSKVTELIKPGDSTPETKAVADFYATGNLPLTLGVKDMKEIAGFFGWRKMGTKAELAGRLEHERDEMRELMGADVAEMAKRPADEIKGRLEVLGESTLGNREQLAGRLVNWARKSDFTYRKEMGEQIAGAAIRNAVIDGKPISLKVADRHEIRSSLEQRGYRENGDTYEFTGKARILEYKGQQVAEPTLERMLREQRRKVQGAENAIGIWEAKLASTDPDEVITHTHFDVSTRSNVDVKDPNGRKVSDVMEKALADNRRWLAEAQANVEEITKALGESVETSLTKTEQAPEAEAPKGDKKSSTQLNLPADIGQTLVDFGKTIDPADLYHGDGAPDSYGPEYGLETEPHITALYGLTTQNAADVAGHVAGHGTVTAKLGEVTAFHNDKYDVLKVDVLAATNGVHDLNSKLRELPHTSDFPDYQPHVTIAYLKPGTADKYTGAKTFSGRTMSFDNLTFSNAEREHTAIPLTGKAEAEQPKAAPAKKTKSNAERIAKQKEVFPAPTPAATEKPVGKPSPKVQAPAISDQASKDLEDAFDGLASPEPMARGREFQDSRTAPSDRAAVKIDGKVYEASDAITRPAGVIQDLLDSSNTPIDTKALLRAYLRGEANAARRVQEGYTHPPGGSLNAPDPITQEELPAEKIGAFVKAAQSLIASGVETPDAMARVLEQKFQGRFRKYSEALWDAFGMAKKSLRGTHDWNGVYQAIDQEAKRSEGEAANEPDANPDQPPTDGGVRPLGGRSGSGHQGEPAGTGERDSKADAGLLEGQPPGNVGDAEPNGHSGEAGTGVGGSGGAVDQGQPPHGDESNGRLGAGGTGLVPDGARGSGNRGNYELTDPSAIQGGGPKVRFGRNRRAIETFQAVSSENREPTPAELDAIAAYIGWGSFGQELFQGNWANPRPKPGWEAEDKFLREALTQKEWEGVQTSIINAHYTAPPIVSAMWGMARRMGFTGGRVLEPALGIGNFFGLMPRDLMAKSQLTGMDLDKLTAGMAAMLYPDANVQQKGYQDSKTADNFYDFIIGNWPFAKDRGFADRRYQDIDPSLHDYFFLKAIDQVRPGGLVMGITSSGTMDKKGAGTRLAIERKADLIGAYRFPSGTFKDYAGTGVVTDLLIFRKREAGEAPAANAPKWRDAVEVDTGHGKITVNEFFANNQKNVLGALDFGHGTTTGRPGMIVNMPADFEKQLASLQDRVPVDGFHERSNADVISHITNNTTDRQGSVVDQADGLFVVRGEHLAPLDDVVKYRLKDARQTAKREGQLKALVAMRRTLGELIDKDRSGADDADALRDNLRKQFEAFRKAHGAINDSDGLAILRKAGDNYWTSLAALEHNAGTREARRYEAATILSRSTMRAKPKMDKPSIQDAYVLHRNETLDINPATIAEMSHTSEADVIKTLTEGGAIFRTPVGTFEPREIYLAGNVRRKLDEAQAAKEAGQPMDTNIAALKEVVPKDTPYFNIEAKLGNTWTTADDYGAFVSHLLNLPADETSMKDRGIDVVYGPGGWVARLSDKLKGSTEATATWGVPYKGIGFNRMLTAAMNNQTLTVWGRDDEGNKFVKTDETKITNAKIEKLREEFTNWVWKDPQRRVRLESSYNHIFNAIATPHFDGSFLSFDGMALERGDSQFGLREHQVNAIWRGVVTGRGIYAHEVGTGKTYTMAGVAVESRRYGKARKPLIFAHNANSATVAREVQEMYPAARVLYVENLDPETRARTMAQIQTDDWDAIVVPHSLVDRFTLKAETLEELARGEIADLEAAALDAAADDGVALDVKDMDDAEAMKKVRSATAKDLVKQRQKIKQRIAEAALKANTDAVFFEDLGVDQLIVDEGHIFKKPPIASKMNLRGLNKAGSGRSINLFFLTEYLRKQNGGAGVHIFTGTPITNTLNEIYNMQRYVMNDVLERDGVAKWDAWFNTFADSVTDAELSPAGDFESVTRLAAFVNVAEMRRMIGEYMDVVFAKNMPEMKPRPTESGKIMGDPALTQAETDELMDGRRKNPEGRPYKNVRTEVAEMSPEQKRIRLLLAERAKTFRGASKRERREIMLSGAPESPVIVETDAANTGLDARLFDPKLPDHPDSKVNRAVANVLRHYNAEEGASQVLFMERGFSDMKTKSQGRDKAGNKLPSIKVPGFNVAADIVRKLVAGGIPESQIAIVDGTVSSAKRKEIADKMNTGEIRVVLGNTQTLGTGVNMQRNLRAMHHLDAPWTPGELEQRNGRGWRQGNEWNTVLEYRYITEGIDGRRWQVLSIKDRFIKAFLNADENTRVIEGDSVSMDDGESISDIAETFGKAAGDPRLIIKAKLRKDVEKLKDRERTHVSGLAEMQNQLDRLDKSVEYNTGMVTSLTKDAAKYAEEAAKPFEITIGDQKFTDREKADEALDEIKDQWQAGKHMPIGSYRGFALTGTKNYGDPTVELGGVRTYTAKPSLGSLDSNLRYIKTELSKTEEMLATAKGSREGLVNSINTPFGRQAELERKEKQLENLSKDIEQYPAPAPAWLREGAPTDTEVYVDGQPRIVKGHRWSRTNYFVLLDGPEGIQAVPYTSVADENGIPIFEKRPFEKPVADAGNNRGPTTPNGWKAGDKFDWGYKGNTYQITEVVAPAQADQADLSKWKFQAENQRTGETQILAADETNMTRVTDVTPPATGGLDAPEPGEAATGDQAPAEQPPKLSEVLRSAYEGLPKIEQIVVRMRMAKASDDEIAAAAGLTTAAVERAYRMALGKLQLAKAGLANLSKRFEEAKAHPDGQRTIGRPDLANVPSGEQSRKLVDTVDDLRTLSGTPETKSDEETSANAQATWDKMGPKGVERMLFEAVKAHAVLSDEQTILAKRLVSQVALTAVRMKDQDKMLHAAMIIDAYRDTGTEWGRAGRQRRDAYATPEERLRQFIGEALLTPDARRRKRLQEAKTPEVKEEILKEWMAKVEELKKKLAALGFDLDRLTDDQITTKLKDRSKAREVVSTIATAKADGWDALYEYWVSSILSAPSTNVANLAGNFGNAAWDFTAQRFTEAAVNTLVRDNASAQFGEFQWLARGIIPGIGRAWTMARQAWTTEGPTFQEEIQGEAGAMKFEGQRVHAIPGKAGRIIRIPLRFLLAADEFSKALFGTMQVHAEAYRIAKAEKLTGDALSKRIQQLATPQHEAIAAVLSKVNPPEALVESIANRIAARRGVDAKDLVRDKQSMAWTMAREKTAFEQIQKDGWRPDAWNSAIDKAVDLAFQEELGPLGKGIIKIRNDVAGLRYFMPFVQTIANIFKTGIRKSPLGSAALLYRVVRSGFVRMNWSGKEWSYTRTQFVQHAAEQLLGWGVMIGLASLVKPPPDDDFPFITGSAPFKGTKRGARDLAYRTAPPQSIRIGQTWYSYARVEPFATQIAATVDLLRASQDAENGLDASKAIGSAYEHLVSQLQDKTFARGIGDVLQAIQDGSSTVEWAGNFATSWVPNIIRASARESDDQVRETRTWGQGTDWAKQFGERVAYKALPLEGNAPPAKVDLWGREVEKDKGMTPATDWVWRLVTPVKEQSIKNVASLDRLITNWNNQHPNDVFAPEAPAPVWSITKDGKPKSVYMTDDEYSRFLKIAGRTALARLEAEGFDTEHPKEADVDKIAKVLTRSRKEARARVWQERAARRLGEDSSVAPGAPPASRAQ